MLRFTVFMKIAIIYVQIIYNMAYRYVKFMMFGIGVFAYG